MAPTTGAKVEKLGWVASWPRLNTLPVLTVTLSLFCAVHVADPGDMKFHIGPTVEWLRL